MNAIASLRRFLEGRSSLWGFCAALVLGAVIAASGCGGDPPNEFAFTNVAREDHVQDFPIAVGAHAVSICNDCHGNFDTFSEFACLDTCHNGLGHPKDETDTDHEMVPGYSYFDASCYSCHGPDGSDPAQGS